MSHIEPKLYAKIEDKPYWGRYIKTEFKGHIQRNQSLCWVNSYLYVKHVIDYELLLSPAVRPKGEDAWGKYYNFTGFEAPGYCFLCGEKVGRRYCKGHRQAYIGNYSWAVARWFCHRKYRINKGDSCHVFFCDDCGCEGSYEDFQVHHIRPLMGHDRNWHWLNHQDNLTHLCHDCHNRTHRMLRKLWRNPGADVNVVIEKQLELF